MTLTRVESVRPSSEGSLFAMYPLSDFAPENVSVGFKAVALNFSVAFVPEPEATLLAAKLRIRTRTGTASMMGVRLRANDRSLLFNKSVSSPHRECLPDGFAAPSGQRGVLDSMVSQIGRRVKGPICSARFR